MDLIKAVLETWKTNHSHHPIWYRSFILLSSADDIDIFGLNRCVVIASFFCIEKNALNNKKKAASIVLQTSIDSYTKICESPLLPEHLLIKDFHTSDPRVSVSKVTLEKPQKALA